MHTCIPSHRLKRSWNSYPTRVNGSNKKNPAHTFHRRNVTTSEVGLKNNPRQKFHKKMLNARDIAGNAEEEEGNITVRQTWKYSRLSRFLVTNTYSGRKNKVSKHTTKSLILPETTQTKCPHTGKCTKSMRTMSESLHMPDFLHLCMWHILACCSNNTITYYSSYMQLLSFLLCPFQISHHHLPLIHPHKKTNKENQANAQRHNTITKPLAQLSIMDVLAALCKCDWMKVKII